MPPTADQAPVDWNAKLAEQGWAPIRGGSPELDEQQPTTPQETPPDAASEQEKPAAEPPAEGAAEQPTTDWEKRYNDLRPQFDRNNQVLAAAKGDHGPEAQIQALQQLGVNVQRPEEEPEEPDLFEDPDERTQREIAEIREDLQQRDEAQEHAEFERLEHQFINGTIDQLEKDENLKLPKEERDWVEAQAKANRHESGEPNLKGAFDALKGIKSRARDEYLASKKQAARAPAGAVGEEQIDLSPKNKEQRNAWMAEQLAAGLED